MSPKKPLPPISPSRKTDAQSNLVIRGSSMPLTQKYGPLKKNSQVPDLNPHFVIPAIVPKIVVSPSSPSEDGDGFSDDSSVDYNALFGDNFDKDEDGDLSPYEMATVDEIMELLEKEEKGISFEEFVKIFIDRGPQKKINKFDRSVKITSGELSRQDGCDIINAWALNKNNTEKSLKILLSDPSKIKEFGEWSSHLKKVCSKLNVFDPASSRLESIKEEGEYPVETKISMASSQPVSTAPSKLPPR